MRGFGGSDKKLYTPVEKFYELIMRFTVDWGPLRNWGFDNFLEIHVFIVKVASGFALLFAVGIFIFVRRPKWLGDDIE